MRINKNNPLAQKNDHQPDLTRQVNQRSGQRLSLNFQNDHGIRLSLSKNSNAQVQEFIATSRYLQNSISLTQIAENALTEVENILLKILDLTIQANARSSSNAVRQDIQTEITRLFAEINHIAKSTESNNQRLLDGSFQNKYLYASSNNNENVMLTLNGITTEELGLTQYPGESTDLNLRDSELRNLPASERLVAEEIVRQGTGNDIATSTSAARSIELINTAITLVVEERSKLGAVQHHLQQLINELGIFSQTIQPAENQKREQNIIGKLTTLSKYNFLAQAVNGIIAKVSNKTKARITFVWLVLVIIILWLVAWFGSTV